MIATYEEPSGELTVSGFCPRDPLREVTRRVGLEELEEFGVDVDQEYRIETCYSDEDDAFIAVCYMSLNDGGYKRIDEISVIMTD